MLMRAISEFPGLHHGELPAHYKDLHAERLDEMQIYLSGRRGMDRIYEDSPHCFDDLGSEPTSVKYMGNEANPWRRSFLPAMSAGNTGSKLHQQPERGRD